MTFSEVCQDANLFGRYFKDQSTWRAWLSFAAALFALPMTAEQLAIYKRHTGRQVAPTAPLREGWIICGRRAGKSFVLALIAVFLACFKSYAEYLGPGERATILIIAADRKQARQIYRYVRGLITGAPLLAAMLEGEPRADGLDLNNYVTIEIGTASFRTSRGYTFAAVLADELAFWPTDDSAEPDYAVLDAVRPGMATIPGAVLLCASSPYARRGALWEAYRKHFGTDHPEILVWRAATREMNPTIPQSVIDRATERDPASASAEYGAEFRSDLEAFVSREIVEAAIDPGVHERPPIDGVRYFAFVDPSGGQSDSMTLAIAHVEKRVLALDAVRERKAPFSPESAVSDFATVLKSYKISRVEGDRFGGAWPAESFARHKISYHPAGKTRSELYRDVLPELNSKTVALLDEPKIIAQFTTLERRTSRGGKDIIDHPPGAHDDLANAIAGALLMAKPSAVTEITIGVCHVPVYDANAAPHLDDPGLDFNPITISGRW